MINNLQNIKSSIESLKKDPELNALISRADKNLSIIGYTEHGWSHVLRVSKRAGMIAKSLGYPENEILRAELAGLMHDIGNAVHRDEHAYSGAIIARSLLLKHKFDYEDVVEVMAAIGSHDDEKGEPISVSSAALIIADKSDVLRNRVRPDSDLSSDIHDRVNYAAKKSEIYVDSVEKKNKTLSYY